MRWLDDVRARFGARERLCRPHLIEAVMAAPLAIDPQFPVTLEGALACAAIASVTGRTPDEVGLGTGDFVDVPIPIADGERCGRLVHRVSVAQGVYLQRERFIRRRTRAEKLALAKVPETMGPYKAHSLPAATRVAGVLRFHAVVDAERLFPLLQGVHGLGRGRQAGFGQVALWRMLPVGEDMSWTVSGAPARPLPVESAEAARKEFGKAIDVGVVGCRAPYWHLKTRALCALPRST